MRDLPKLSIKKIDLGNDIASDSLEINNLNLEIQDSKLHDSKDIVEKLRMQL